MRRSARMWGEDVSRSVNGVRRPENEEIRSYILNMAAELAVMAEQIQESDLADHLRFIAWPGHVQEIVPDAH